MGDPRRSRKQFSKPKVPFEGPRILEELEYLGKYGLRNKTEFWKHRSQLGHYRKLIRELRTTSEEERKRVFADVSGKLNKLGLVGENPTFDDVLSLKVENFLDRRLQTVVYKKGLARSIQQSRQLITHGHIIIDGKKTTSPSRLVTTAEEASISFFYKSPLNGHPEKVWGATGQSGEEAKDKGASKGEGYAPRGGRRPEKGTRRARRDE